MTCDDCQHYRRGEHVCGALLGQLLCRDCGITWPIVQRFEITTKKTKKVEERTQVTCPKCGERPASEALEEIDGGQPSEFCPGFVARPVPVEPPPAAKPKAKKTRTEQPTLF